MSVRQSLDVYIQHLDQHKQFENTLPGIERLLCHIGKFDIDLIICEPSGGYERLFLVSASLKHFPVVMINARQIRGFTRAKGLLAKTDTIDA